MQQIKTLLKKHAPAPRNSRSERGDLLEFFMVRLRAKWDAKKFGMLSYPRLAKKLQGLTITDLYYMKSIMSDLERQKGNEAAVKWFWYSLRPQES